MVAKGRSRRRLWLWLGLLLTAGALFRVAVPLGTWQEYQNLPRPPGDWVVVYNGVHEDAADGQRASLRRLSQELARHPSAVGFIIRRAETPLAWDEIDWSETAYDRQRHTIIDGNINLGDTVDWGKVSDQEVRAAAASGSFDIFGRSGCENDLP